MQELFVKSLMLTLSVVLLIGCKKDVREPAINNSIQSEIKVENGNKIRLAAFQSAFGYQTFSYNSDGLINEWVLPFFEYTTQIEYDEAGKFASSLIYIGSTLTYTIDFFYEKDRVVKEVWYDGTTNNVFDEVFYTYSANGLMLSSESFLQDYYNVYEYTTDRLISGFVFYIGGVPSVRLDYTYLLNYKNPLDAIPGLSYAFIFVDGGFYENKLYPTSVSATYYDEFGNVVFEDFQDPTLTTMTPGPQHYPSATSFYNIAFDSYSNFSFTYENCGSCPSGKIGRNSVNTNNLKYSLNKFLVRDAKHQMKQRAADLRTDVLKFKNIR